MEVESMGIEKMDGFVVSTTKFDGEPTVLVHHRMLFNHPLAPAHRYRIIIIIQEKD